VAEKRFIMNMLANMFNTMAGKKIAIFGFAFKANTGDTRESAAIYVTRGLLEEHARVVISDPKALDNARKDLSDVLDRVILEPDPYKARGAHAIAVLTEWSIYRDLDFRRILKSMVHPAFIFDGRNILEHKRLYELGFNVFPVGKTP